MSISLPRAQRRLVDAQHAQAVIKVRAEAPGLDRAVEVDVSGRDDPYVDRNRFLPAEPLDLAFLQEAQQARLAFDRHVADFVEKQRAAVRRFDPARAPLVRAGERAALVAEQFRLQQVMRNRAAIDRDERPLAAAGALVNRERRQLLPVPDSPEMNTLASVFATLRIVLNSCCIASQLPIIPCSPIDAA